MILTECEPRYGTLIAGARSGREPSLKRGVHYIEIRAEVPAEAGRPSYVGGVWPGQLVQGRVSLRQWICRVNPPAA